MQIIYDPCPYRTSDNSGDRDHKPKQASGVRQMLNARELSIMETVVVGQQQGLHRIEQEQRCVLGVHFPHGIDRGPGEAFSNFLARSTSSDVFGIHTPHSSGGTRCLLEAQLLRGRCSDRAWAALQHTPPPGMIQCRRHKNTDDSSAIAHNHEAMHHGIRRSLGCPTC